MAPPRSATDRPDLGERFARAIAAKDQAALKVLLAPHVSFRALTPGKAWEASDAEAVVDEIILGKWFSPERVITAILRIDSDPIGAVDHVAYRFRAQRPDGEFVIEQQAYLTTEHGRISWLQILCSGYVAEQAVTTSPGG